MSITPQDFLRSAEELAATDDSEVYQRNAISRLYYAAYHRSCEYIEPDRNDRDAGAHRSYIQQLTESDPGTIARKLGVSLGAVYSGRIRSDYKLAEDVLPRDFSMLLNRTRDIFTLIDTPPQQPPAHKTPKLQIIR